MPETGEGPLIPGKQELPKAPKAKGSIYGGKITIEASRDFPTGGIEKIASRRIKIIRIKGEPSDVYEVLIRQNPVKVTSESGIQNSEVSLDQKKRKNELLEDYYDQEVTNAIRRPLYAARKKFDVSSYPTYIKRDLAEHWETVEACKRLISKTAHRGSEEGVVRTLIEKKTKTQRTAEELLRRYKYPPIYPAVRELMNRGAFETPDK